MCSLHTDVGPTQALVVVIVVVVRLLHIICCKAWFPLAELTARQLG